MPRGVYIRTPENQKNRLESMKHIKNTWSKNLRMTDEQKKRVSDGRKGIPSWNKGLKGYMSGDKHYRWKGGQTKEERSWQSNRRNRVIKRLKDGGYGHTFGDWELLKKQYGYTCPCCKRSEPEIKLTEDHIIPLSMGGSDLIENIQPLCLSCNVRKFTKIIKF